MTTIISGGQGASTNGAATAGTKTSGQGKMPENPLLDVLTKRLTQQAEGISSSSSSALQSEIAAAMDGVQAAGDLTAQRLQSEREREIGFARDRAGATYTGALEGRTGYATQVSALRELTDTTEKSVRDLDKRYQEALLANDANTASQMSDLRMKKLEFQQQQEQNFFSNVMSVANLQQSAIDSMMRREEFWAGQEQAQNQFVIQMARSAYEFEQNLGLQYKELGLKEQELQIAWDRNAISREELNLKKNEINKEKTTTTLQSIVYDRMKKFATSGGDLNSKDAIEWQQEIISELGPTFPMLAEMQPEEVATFIDKARLGVEEGIKTGAIIVPQRTTNNRVNTGLFPVIGRDIAGAAGNVGSWLDKIFWSGSDTSSKSW